MSAWLNDEEFWFNESVIVEVKVKEGFVEQLMLHMHVPYVSERAVPILFVR